MRHFLSVVGPHLPKYHSFESFAGWYTKGGFNVAPWLELLDLSKVLSLVANDHKKPPSTSPPPHPATFRQQRTTYPSTSTSASASASASSNMVELRSPHRLPDAFIPPPTAAMAQPKATPLPPSRSSTAEVMFTFPLANGKSLVVLREDATYVKDVVNQLGLIEKTPDVVWAAMYSSAYKALSHKPNAAAHSKDLPVDKAVFLHCMGDVVPVEESGKGSRKRSRNTDKPKANAQARELLSNLYHSFDLHQMDQVGLNELMGGLTLLCGGKKSTKLAFAFGVFDRRPRPKTKTNKRSKKERQQSEHTHSLGGEEIFLFLRSFLIMMFSCCRQSLDLTDHLVGRYIADTANMVTEDVMRYQWTKRKKDRIDFDEFGEWYNEGGFEAAPWLELLDLRKWVLDNPSQDISRDACRLRRRLELQRRRHLGHRCIRCWSRHRPPCPKSDWTLPALRISRRAPRCRCRRRSLLMALDCARRHRPKTRSMLRSSPMTTTSSCQWTASMRWI